MEKTKESLFAKYSTFLARKFHKALKFRKCDSFYITQNIFALDHRRLASEALILD